MKNLSSYLLVLAACGGGSDAKVDAPPAASVVTITGVASARNTQGSAPEVGVLVAAYAKSNENTPLAMSTTDAAGAFTLSISTSGTAVDGFLKATKTGFATSYLYPPTPISADLAMVPMNMLTTTLFDLLYSISQTSPISGTGVVAVLVVGGAELTSPPVPGATIETSPASPSYRYNSMQGLPNKDVTVTAADGIGYAMNAPPGTMTVTAKKSGSTFKTTSIKVHADALIQTLVIQ
jgi:hypothetical protein